MELSAKALATFDLVVDTILPATEGEGEAWKNPGRDLGFSAMLPSVFERLPHDLDRRDLIRFLGLLNSPAASGVNPMLSIAAIAHRDATLLARQTA